MRNEKGFTLIELMVVVVIIGILSAIAIPRFIGAARRARVKACIADITLMREALGMYITDYGVYSTDDVGSEPDYRIFKKNLHPPDDTIPYTTLAQWGATFDTIAPLLYVHNADGIRYLITAPVLHAIDVVHATQDSLWVTP